jgi:hypothetical protein
MEKFGYKLSITGKNYFIVFEKQIYNDKTLARILKISTSKFHSILIKKFNGVLKKRFNNFNNRVFFENELDAKKAAEYLDSLYTIKKLIK